MIEKHLEERDLRELEDQGFVLGCTFLAVAAALGAVAFWGIGALVWKLTGMGFGH